MSGAINAAVSLADNSQTVYEQLGLKDKEIYTGNSTVTREVSQTIDKDAFLQLMVTKLQNQDPLSPTDDTEFLAQLAQFTTLEQMTNLAESSELTQAFSMVGKYVQVSVGDENIISKIDSVLTSGGEPKFNIGGYLFSMDDILSVYDEESLTFTPITPDGDAESDADTDNSGAEAVNLAEQINNVAAKYNSLTVE